MIIDFIFYFFKKQRRGTSTTTKVFLFISDGLQTWNLEAKYQTL